MRTAWHHPLANLARRAFALGCVLLVLGLAVFAASPELHRKLHAGDTDGGVDTCAVALFAAGVAACCMGVPLAAPRVVFAARALLPLADIFVAPARYLRQPERGPPALG